VPHPGIPLKKLGFLTIGIFDGDDPGPGHRTTLEIIELGERLGFDSAWVRHRHRQYGISSPVAILAAGSAFALPFTFEHEDYVQILTDMAEKLGPALGWQR
jgi:hypothetical protein